MSIREDLVSSAASFLQDPSVANAPLDKRIAFLQSKNLTQEEVDASLARAGSGESAQAPAPQQNYSYQQQPARQPPPPPQQYGYPPQGYWQQPPPEVPGRDWRDYFIMATVMSGLGYGVYTLAKRYVVPLIAPPTPPQLEQDKASIDESFKRAFDLIDQLSTDTAAIKSSEEARKEKLDEALSDMERAVDEMKIAARRRDEDSKRMNDEVRGLHALVPKAMKAQEEATDGRLRELNQELKSLKTLISNRMSGQGVAQTSVPRSSAPNAGANMFGSQGTANTNGSTEEKVAEAPPKPTVEPVAPAPATASAPQQQPDRASAGSPAGRFGQRGGIPAWQMAAAKKEDKDQETQTADGEDSAASSSLVS